MLEPLRVSFRVDASQKIGTGHVRRCLSLAQALKKFDAQSRFICRQHDEVSAHLIPTHQACDWLAASTQTFSDNDPNVAPPYASWGLVPWQLDADQTIAVLKKAPVDWLVVDHYAWDARWHQRVTAEVNVRLLAIDDLADRSLSADMLLDQNLDQNHFDKYKHCISFAGERVRLMAGPRYALLSDRYKLAPRYEFSKVASSIGIFMGGTDPDDLSSQVLLACREVAKFTGRITLVSSQQNPHYKGRLALAAKWPQTRVIHDLPDLSDFFASHDLQIGSGGGAAWERCCMGAPTLAVVAATNQQAVLPQLAGLQAVRLVELTKSDSSLQAFGKTVAELLADPVSRQQLSEKSISLVDGRGSARVAAVLALAVSSDLTLRPAVLDDEALLLEWSNESQTRRNAFDTEPIGATSHAVWLRSRLRDTESCALYIAEVKNAMPVGTIRFDREALPGESFGSEVWRISYGVDVSFRSLGLARVLVQQGLERLAQTRVATCTVKALVKPNNIASMKTFESLSFTASRAACDDQTVSCFEKVLRPL